MLNFPKKNREDYTRDDIEPFIQQLLGVSLENDDIVLGRLSDYSLLRNFIVEIDGRLKINYESDLRNEEAKRLHLLCRETISAPGTLLIADLNKKFLTYDIDGFSKRFPEWKSFISYAKISQKHIIDENIRIDNEINQILGEYSKLIATTTINDMDGNQIPFQRAKLSDSDSEVRIFYFNQILQLRITQNKQFNDIFNKLLHLRYQIAHNAGYSNYLKFAYQDKLRFDYTSEQVLQCCYAIRITTQEMDFNHSNDQTHKLGVVKLKPYDRLINSKPITVPLFIQDLDLFFSVVQKSITGITSLWGYYLNDMKNASQLLLESGLGKRSGASHKYMPFSQISYIFMNYSGKIDNFRTLCHEFGHSLHSKLNRDMGFLTAVSAEVKELASISMEYFAFEELANHVNVSDYANMMVIFLEGKLESLRSFAHAEEFQTHIYTSPTPDMQLVQNTINELLVKYDTGVRDWSGYEIYRQLSWHYHSHTYRSPLYNTEYIFANLGAIQLWQLYRKDKEDALKHYINILSSGSKFGVADTYQIGGLELVPSAEKVKELIEFVDSIRKKYIGVIK